ncbi:hypothetical protein NS365_12990 [Aureimonas ureilytica]|uniref:Holin n=1 Tax=Aureimonas ureilytica TaxID=401562 RepID=A0A175RQ16_9HYPH|nr:MULTISPECIES: hypothetical protein [Aureimonas]KTQ85335.1 hypothetical protein NS226_20140 [Aureimonas ureilytica]KTR04952.1 hypothetical protein NS365_12990 [Aureimonas ureilytica]
MNDTKDWWKSKTVWGALVSMGASLAALRGFELDGLSQDQLAGTLAALASAIGAAVAILGRFQARSEIR